MSEMNEQLTARFRKVLDEHDHGALGGRDLAEALAQAVEAHDCAHDCVADQAIVKLRGLGCDDDTIRERLTQAAMLEAAGATAEHVQVVSKIAAQGRMTHDDILRLQRLDGTNTHTAGDGAPRAAHAAPQDGDARERLIEVLTQKEHAPMSDHDPRDGSCRSCPWPLHMLSPDEIADSLLAALPVLSRSGEPPHIPYPGEPYDPEHLHDWADGACQSPLCMARPDGTTQRISRDIAGEIEAEIAHMEKAIPPEIFGPRTAGKFAGLERAAEIARNGR